MRSSARSLAADAALLLIGAGFVLAMVAVVIAGAARFVWDAVMGEWQK